MIFLPKFPTRVLFTSVPTKEMLKVNFVVLGTQGGNLKNSEQGDSVYFFGSEIWLKFTFLGEKNYNYFFGLEIFEIIFLGSLKVTKCIFGGVLGTDWVTFFVHNSVKKKDRDTHYTHIKLDRGRGTSIIPSMAVEKKCIQHIRCAIWLTFWQTIFLQSLGSVYFMKLLESLSERIVLHFSLTCSFTHMKVNF